MRVVDIPSGLLVRGDVVLLEAGDRVPADGRLLAVSAVAVAIVFGLALVHGPPGRTG